jgi:hypothetical protein
VSTTGIYIGVGADPKSMSDAFGRVAQLIQGEVILEDI